MGIKESKDQQSASRGKTVFNERLTYAMVPECSLAVMGTEREEVEPLSREISYQQKWSNLLSAKEVERQLAGDYAEPALDAENRVDVRTNQSNLYKFGPVGMCSGNLYGLHRLFQGSSIVILTTIFLSLGCVGVEGQGLEHQRMAIAVMGVREERRQGSPSEDIMIFNDRLTSAVVNLGTLRPVGISKVDVRSILMEIARQQKWSDPASAKRVGKMLAADYVITGTVKPHACYQVMHLETVDVESAAIVKSADPTFRGSLGDFSGEDIQRIAKELDPTAGGPAQVFGTPSCKATWALWTGGLVLVGAAGLQYNALSTHKDAMSDADEAQRAHSTDLYAQAQDKEKKAQTLQKEAAVLGIVGAVFVTYYLLSGDSGTATASLGPDAAHPPPVQVALQEGGVFLGYSMRW